MLEGSYLGSRDLPASCEQESQWAYNAARVGESSSKRPLEDGEDMASRKAARPIDAQEEQQDLEGLHVLPLLQINQSNNKHQEGLHALSVLKSDQPNQHQVLNGLPIAQTDKPDQHQVLSSLPIVQTDKPDQHQVLSGLPVTQTDRPFNQQMEDLPVFSAVQIGQPPDEQHQEGGLLVLPAVESDEPDQCQEAGLTDSFVMQTHQPDDQHQVAGLHILCVVQTDEPHNQHEANGLQGLSNMLPNQPDNQDQVEDESDTSSLINQLGRELTINCLLYCSRSDYGTTASLNKSFQSLVQSGLLYKLRREMGIVEHWVYFSCNLLEWEAFDPICRRWMHLPRMNSNECFTCSDKESLAVGTELLVFGKEIESHVIFRYSILTNMWTSNMRMNTPRCLFGSASLGEIAILAGGCDPSGNVLSSAELYNSETGMWVTLPSMHQARKMCSGVFMDGKFYVIGGVGAGNKNVITYVEVYDLATKTWHEMPDMSPERNLSVVGNVISAAAEAPPLIAVVNNELYAADYAQKELQKYDKEKKVWLTLGELPEGAVSMNGWGLAFRGCGDKLIVIGGPRGFGEGVIELNSWVPNADPPQWDLLARKRSGGFVYNCAVMGC